MKRARVVLFAGLALVSGGAGSAWAAGNDGATCVAAFEDAQRLRSNQRLLAAREALVACARASCPKVIADRCQKWKDAVEATIPTIKLVVVDEGGRPATGSRVWIDERAVVVPDDGVITLDPGPHGARAERPRAKPAESRFELKAGDKERVVTLRLERDGSVDPAASASAAGSERPPAAEGIPPASYALGGVSFVALGVFAYLGLSARHDERTLAATCAPACKPDDVSALRSKYIGADVALGVGVVSLGIAAWLAFSASPDAAVSVGVGPTGAIVRGTF